MAFLASIKSKKMKDKITHQTHERWIDDSGKQLPGLELYLRFGEAFVLVRGRPSSFTLPAIASVVCISDALHTFVGGLHLISCTDDGDKHAQEKFLRADLVLKKSLEHFQQKEASLWGSGKPPRLIHQTCKTLITQAKQELWMLNRAALHYIKTKKNHKTLTKGQMSCFESNKAIST